MPRNIFAEIKNRIQENFPDYTLENRVSSFRPTATHGRGRKIEYSFWQYSPKFIKCIYLDQNEVDAFYSKIDSILKDLNIGIIGPTNNWRNRYITFTVSLPENYNE